MPLATAASRALYTTRFSVAKSATLVPALYGGIIDGSQFGGGDQTVDVYSGALSWTRIYSPTLVSETRFGYSSISHARLPLNATDTTIAPRFGLKVPDPDYPFMGGLPFYTVDGIGQFGVPNNLPSIQYQNTYQVSTTFSKLSGNHRWKWGFQFSRPMTEFFQPAAPRGGYGYSGAFTDVPTTTGGGTGMAQMLLNPIAQRFELRAEIFNLTNTHNFSVPGFSGGGAGLPPPPGVLDFSNTANFGKVTALRLGPNDQRQIQLALKYYF